MQLAIPTIKKEIDSRTALQRALCMNLARCYMRRSPPLTGWAIRMTSLSIGISKYMIQQLEECSSQAQGATCFSLPQQSLSHIDHVVDTNLGSKQMPILHLSVDAKVKTREEIVVDANRENIFESSNERENLSYPSEVIRFFVTLIITILASLYKYICCREMIGTERKEDGNHTNKNNHPNLNLAAKPIIDSFKPDSRKDKPTEEPVGDEIILLNQLSDGFYLRSKAYLIASRPQLAKKVRRW